MDMITVSIGFVFVASRGGTRAIDYGPAVFQGIPQGDLPTAFGGKAVEGLQMKGEWAVQARCGKPN